MSIEIRGQPLTDIPIGRQYQIRKVDSGSKSELQEIEQRVNDLAARLLEAHLSKTGEKSSDYKVTAFKVKRKDRSGRGIHFESDTTQADQLRDMENWMAPYVQVLSFVQRS